MIHGAAYSVYTRIARLAFLEKGVAPILDPVDVFSAGGPPARFLRDHHPFGRIPAMTHGSLRLYETAAIVRYADAGFPGPPLTPEDAVGQARMAQAISVADSYVYPWLVWGVYVPHADGEAVSDDARARASHCLAAVADLLGRGPWFAADRCTLADLYMAANLACVDQVAAGGALIDAWPGVRAWLARMRDRPSLQATADTETVAP